MKKLFLKIGSVLTSVLAFIGISSNVIASTNNIDRDAISHTDKQRIIAQVTEQTPLYLYNADQIVFDGAELIAQHYSHSSHSSHYSHSSHSSHYSHSSHSSHYSSY